MPIVYSSMLTVPIKLLKKYHTKIQLIYVHLRMQQGISDVKTRGMKSVLNWLVKHASAVVQSTLGWTFGSHPMKGIPQQENGIDCGPYVFKYMQMMSMGR